MSAPIRTRPAERPASLLDAAGRPSIPAIKAHAAWLASDPAVGMYGSRRPALRSVLWSARAAADREAERAALPPLARTATDRLAGLNAQHDALFFAPGYLAHNAAELAVVEEMREVERANIAAVLEAAFSAPEPVEFRRAA